MRHHRLLASLLVATAVAAPACTDLSEDPYSVITPEKFYQNDDEVRSGLAAVYSQLNTVSTGNYNYISIIASDEQVIPVRGQDWFDNGQHLETQRHGWGASSSMGLNQVNSAWVGARRRARTIPLVERDVGMFGLRVRVGGIAARGQKPKRTPSETVRGVG